MMDCDTTGIEPDFSLVKYKKLVGGGSMQIVNQTVPRALKSLGYQDEQIEAIVEYIAEHGHVVDAPSLRRSEEHTSELQSRQYLVCRLLLEKKNKKNNVL